MTPTVYYGDGSIVVFPCIFPAGAAAVLVNGASSAFTQGAGIVTRVNVRNQAAYAVFLKLYDTAAAVTVGTTVPKVTIVIPATANVDISSLVDPLRFDNGIAFTVTKLVADSDTTALAADDVHGFINAQ